MIVAAAKEMPQLVTLCGIQPEQAEIDFSRRRLDVSDAKLIAFDLSKNGAVRVLKCAWLRLPNRAGRPVSLAADTCILPSLTASSGTTTALRVPKLLQLC